MRSKDHIAALVAAAEALPEEALVVLAGLAEALRRASAARPLPPLELLEDLARAFTEELLAERERALQLAGG